MNRDNLAAAACGTLAAILVGVLLGLGAAAPETGTGRAAIAAGAALAAVLAVAVTYVIVAARRN